MKTAGTIASVLGAMLLGGMGGGMFKDKGKEDEGEATKKLPSDDMTEAPKTFTPTPDTTDYKAMMDKYAAGALHSNANINKMLGDMPKIPSNFDPRAARDGGDDYRYDGGMSNEALMGEPMPQAIKIPGLTSDANDTSLPSQSAGPKSYQQMIREERAMPQLPKRPANVPGPRTVQEGYEQEKLYKGSEEPGYMEKLIQSISGIMLPDKTRNPYYRDPNDPRRWRTSSGDRQMSNGK